MLSNTYLLANFHFDTAENEPAENLQNLPILLSPGTSSRRIFWMTKVATVLESSLPVSMMRRQSGMISVWSRKETT